tara:strand:- start:14 stop:217 length:204 start_codon:yes stop_codon:yes gene_type:complete
MESEGEKDEALPAVIKRPATAAKMVSIVSTIAAVGLGYQCVKLNGEITDTRSKLDHVRYDQKLWMRV